MEEGRAVGRNGGRQAEESEQVNYRGFRRGADWGPREWAIWHSEKRDELSRMFFGIDADITKAFYNLDRRQLSIVLNRYAAAHGTSARTYAERTYPKWRNGKITPSAQTLTRLLNCVPPALSLVEKAALIAKLRRKSRTQITAQIRCKGNELRAILTAQFTRVMQSVIDHTIPPHVRNALDWLGSSIGSAAEAVLRASEYLEASHIVAFAKREIDGLEEAAARTDVHRDSVHRTLHHVIDCQYCRISVLLDLSDSAPGHPSHLGATMSDPILPRRPGDLLENLTQGLTEQEKAKLREIAAREQMGLEVKARGAGLSHSAAKADIERDLDAVDRLQYSQSDVHYEVKGTYQGASGQTHIEVRKKGLPQGMIKWIFWGVLVLGLLWLLNR